MIWHRWIQYASLQIAHMVMVASGASGADGLSSRHCRLSKQQHSNGWAAGSGMRTTNRYALSHQVSPAVPITAAAMETGGRGEAPKHAPTCLLTDCRRQFRSWRQQQYKGSFISSLLHGVAASLSAKYRAGVCQELSTACTSSIYVYMPAR